MDAARGIAMLLILATHFGTTYFDPADPRARLLEKIGLVASPTFMLISGALVGFLYRTRPRDFPRLRLKLLDRGLFLLTVGHLLMFLGCWALVRTGRYILITDTIGIAMMVGPWAVSRLSAPRRLALAAAVLAVNWSIVLLWHPSATGSIAIREALFGSLDRSFFAFTFPVLPWCCLDLVGSALGDFLGRYYLAGSPDGMARLLTFTGLGSIVVGATAKASCAVLQWAFAALRIDGSGVLAAAQILTSPHLKWPPSPAYFLFQGGIGICLLAGLWHAERRGWALGWMNRAVALGQSSLFMFVTQFYVYFTVVHLLRPYLPFAGAWPIYLFASMLLVVLPAFEFHRRGYRRFITVGVGRWVSRPLASAARRDDAALAPLFK